MIFWNKSPGKKIIGDRKRFVNICVFSREASVLLVVSQLLHQTRLPHISHLSPLLAQNRSFSVRRGKVWFLLLSSWSWSSLGASPPWTFYFIAMTCVSQGNNKRTENNQRKWLYKKIETGKKTKYLHKIFGGWEKERNHVWKLLRQYISTILETWNLICWWGGKERDHIWEAFRKSRPAAMMQCGSLLIKDQLAANFKKDAILHK